jgi:hypothetical protein
VSNKHGFQAAIPETLRSAARVKINRRFAPIPQKIQPLQRLDTIDEHVEQKNFFVVKTIVTAY